MEKQHYTIEQIHRLTHKISQDLEKKKYCSALFLVIQQVFDTHYSILISYLTNRLFMI